MPLFFWCPCAWDAAQQLVARRGRPPEGVRLWAVLPNLVPISFCDVFSFVMLLSNLLRDEAGRLKVSDFGLSRARGGNKSMHFRDDSGHGSFAALLQLGGQENSCE